MWHQSAIFEKSWPSFCQIWIILTHLKLWIASITFLQTQALVQKIIAFLHKQRKILQLVRQVQWVTSWQALGIGSKLRRVGFKSYPSSCHPISCGWQRAGSVQMVCFHTSAWYCERIRWKRNALLVGGMCSGLLALKNNVVHTLSAVSTWSQLYILHTNLSVPWRFRSVSSPSPGVANRWKCCWNLHHCACLDFPKK